MNMKTLATMALSIAMLATPTFAKTAQKPTRTKKAPPPLPAATYGDARVDSQFPVRLCPLRLQELPRKEAAEKRGVSCRRGKMDDFLKELAK